MGAAHQRLYFNGIGLTSAEMPRHAAHVLPPARIVVPDTHKKRIVYETNFYDSVIDGYKLPGLKAVSDPTGDSEPQGMCTGAKGTFWVANSGGDDVLEYDYDGTSIVKTLSESAGEPAGCSVDPTTGNVAMSVLFTDEVEIWTGGTGSPTTSIDGLLETYFVGYDGSGDLFANGFNSSFAVAMVELKKGSTTWTPLTGVSIGFPGGMQWDGTYITVEDQTLNANKIDQYSCSGTSCTLAGSVSLAGSEDCDSPWIKGAVVACGDIGDDEVKLYHYPAGGSPYADVAGQDGPIGSVILK
jgi:hypothetical protein